MVSTPDIPHLPFVMHNHMKYFELVAEPVQRELLPGLFIRGWGYNGTIPGPTIQVYPGDFVNIRVINRLPEPTSVHWHGLDVPNIMDGVPEVEPSPQINVNHYFDYYFQITNPPGTHMYHTHFHTIRQELMGLGGAFIILDPYESHLTVHNDSFLMLQEFHVKGLKKGEVKPGIYEVDPLAHDSNFFTMNGRCFPFTTPLKVRYGERVRVRMGNIGKDAHPIHLHGHQMAITATDGNNIPKHSQLRKNTILVASGETYDCEFTANNPGIWPLHCHIPHHTSNNMMEGAGGMFTTVTYDTTPFYIDNVTTHRKVMGYLKSELHHTESPSSKLLTLQTKNTTRVNQDNGIFAAIETSQMVWPSTDKGNRPNTVLVGVKGDWKVNLPAVSLVHFPDNGPLLYAEKDKIPLATMNEIHRLNPKGRKVDGTQIILIGKFSDTVQKKLKKEGWKVEVIKSQDTATTAKSLDAYNAQLKGGKFSSNIIIGSMDAIQFTLPVANWIAHMPTTLLYVSKDSIPKPTRESLQQRRKKANIYIMGPETMISKQVEEQLRSYGKVSRISGSTPEENAITFAKYKDPTTQFGWGITHPGHGLIFNRLNHVDSAISSAAFAHLGKHGPMLILEKPFLSEPIIQYLMELQPKFKNDPTKGPYNHAYLIGTLNRIPYSTQGMIDELLEAISEYGGNHQGHTTRY